MNIKKGLLAILITGQFINASQEFSSAETFNQLAVASFNNYTSEINSNKKAASLWYLKHFEREMLFKNIDDEFTLEDIINDGYKKFTEEIKNKKDMLNNTTFEVRRFESFGKYNFEKEHFPIDKDDNKLSIWFKDLYSKKDAKGTTNYAKLTFINFDKSKNLLPMQKNDAKNYLSKRKSLENAKHLQRTLNVKYTFKIKDITASTKSRKYTIPYILSNCSINKRNDDTTDDCGKALSVFANAEILKIEYFDKADGEKYWNRKKDVLLHTVNY